jgi:tRNA threonylcarbamoyladenosine biosynthesis protein TsaE
MIVIERAADAAATRALAGRLAPLLRPGDVILVEGDLGAGKTTFTQGLARALGVDETVTSPTFVLMNIYRTSAGFDLVHVDVYRLDRLSEVVDLALPELLEDGAVVVVEWGERAAAALPGGHLQVRIEAGEDDERIIRLDGHGPEWAGRLGAIPARA